jgi:hypothetical protein
MPDNIAAPAAGTIFATDDIGGVHYPYAKLVWGPNDTAIPVADANGQRLPVVITIPTGQQVGLDAPTLAALGTVDANVTGIVALDAATLAALENITVAVQEPPALVLATAATLAAGAATAPLTGVQAGSYIFEAIFTGADLQLQRLGPDGATWINAGVLAASGSVGVVLAANDSIRLRNNSAASITGLFARVA